MDLHSCFTEIVVENEGSIATLDFYLQISASLPKSGKEGH